jgi:hypothetical protein
MADVRRIRGPFGTTAPSLTRCGQKALPVCGRRAVAKSAGGTGGTRRATGAGDTGGVASPSDAAGAGGPRLFASFSGQDLEVLTGAGHHRLW